MRLSQAVASLTADLAALGALGDEHTAETARRLAAAIEGPVAARLVELLGQITAEYSSGSDSRLELRLVGGDLELVMAGDPPGGGDLAEEPDGGADARITLRLPAPLKSRIEVASTREGVSVNAWIVRTLAQQGQSGRTERNGPRGQHLRGRGIS